MIDMKVMISAISEFLKDKLYPSLEPAMRAKISVALFTAALNPTAALTLLLCRFMPNTPIENTVGTAQTFGYLDEQMKVCTGKLLGAAKAYIAELGTYEIDLFGVKFDITEAHIDSLSGYVNGKK